MRSTILRTATARLRSAKPYPHTAHFRQFVLTLLMALLTATAWADDDFVDNGDGSYIIHNVDDWSQFASSVNDGTTYSGQTVKLDADIEVSEMVGTSAHKFSGTFDGCGHTLTFDKTATTDNCAPFAYIDGATFKRLTVAGTISTDNKFAAGIAAHSYGDCTILSCRSSIAIESSFSGDGIHAGFVAVQEAGTLTITNCLFDGSITGSDTYNCAGFVGWRSGDSKLTFNNCLQNGTLSLKQESGSATFNRNGGSTFNSCYYRVAYGDVQGTQTSATGSDLKDQLGSGWQVSDNDAVVPVTDGHNLGIATVSGISQYYIHTGEAIQPEPTVVDFDGTPLTKDTHYTVTWSDDCITDGDYTVTVCGMDPYYGSQAIIYTVRSTERLGEYDFRLGVDDDGLYCVVDCTDALVALASYVNADEQNTCSGKRFVQADDITYTGDIENYIAIGTESHPFCGTFDGKGKAISGIRINQGSAGYQGLFGYVGSGGTVKNVLLSDAVITGGSYTGAIVGLNEGTLTANYYHGCTVNAQTTNVGTGAGDADGARSVHVITLPENVTATGESVVIGSTTYYAANTTFWLAYTEPAGKVFSIFNVKDASGEALAFRDYPNKYKFTMPASDVTVSVTWVDIPWAGTGTEDDPYTIGSKSDLDSLAAIVNDSENGIDFREKFFVMTADITYEHETEWNDPTSEENNFTPIGFMGFAPRFFIGHFDGANHVVSGIRIYKDESGDEYDNYCQGLFGILESGIYCDSTKYFAEVKNVILADARITGFNSIGGIVGRNGGGTIENCHVLSDVTIHAVPNKTESWGDPEYPENHGGIVGNNTGFIDHCTSAASITIPEDLTDCNNYGGVVGKNFASVDDKNYSGTVSNCLYLGDTLEGTTHVGAIVGCNNDPGFLDHLSIVENCYYTDTNINGKDKDGNPFYDEDGNPNDDYEGDPNDDYEAYECAVGYNYSSEDGKARVTNCGLISTDNSTFITMMAQRTAALTAVVHTTPINFILYGRTLYKDGAWNTLCLPFDVTLSGSPLEGATVKELVSSSFEDGTLTMNFSDNLTAIEAGKSYIIKWASGSNIREPEFAGVILSSTTPGTATTDCVDFVGTYNPIVWDTENRSILFLGAENTLYFPQPKDGKNPSLGAFRAYFQLKGITAGDVASARMSFDEETTEIRTTDNTDGTDADSWYTLDGRKITGKPTTKGFYINGNKKVYVK